MVYSSAMLSLLLGALPLGALAAPFDGPILVNTSAQSINPRQNDIRPYMFIDPNCGRDESEGSRFTRVKAAIADAVRLAAPLQHEYLIEGQWQLAASRYFGLGMNDDHPLPSDGANIVAGNLWAASQISKPYTSLPEEDWMLQHVIRVSCDKDHPKCANPGIFAEAVNGADSNGQPLYVIYLCQGMFDQQVSLNELLTEYEGKPIEFATLDYLQTSYGGSFLHELMHIDLITRDRGHVPDGFDPESHERLTGPRKISRVAKSGNSDLLLKNAESWKSFALEIFFNKAFGYRPVVKVQDVPKKTCASASQDVPKYAHRQEVTGPIEDFCTDWASYYVSHDNWQHNGRWSKDYNDGTPLSMKLEAEWDRWARMSQGIAAADCKDKMYQVLDGCDTNTLYKHGGEIDSSRAVGTQFRLTMEAERPPAEDVPAAKCDVWYHFLPGYDQVYMKGAGFAARDYGQDVLLPQLKKCRGVTGWKFTYGLEETSGVQYEWSAEAKIVIGAQQWGCVRNAMIAAGATSSLGCGGH